MQTLKNSKMTPQKVKDKGWLIFEGLTGSHAYGTNVEGSDHDYRGIFVQPTEEILRGNRIDQVADKTNDVVYYEVGRYLELLAKGNPNILELLNLPSDCITVTTDIFDNYIAPLKNIVVSKLLEKTFGGYAYSQIKRATGLKKKMNNPMEKKRKTPLDFCFIINKEDGHSVPLTKWLKKNDLQQKYCGLAAVSNGEELYKLYYDYVKHLKEQDGVDNPRIDSQEGAFTYKGIIQSEESNGLALSSIEKFAVMEAFLWFNKNGYSIYCKQYKEYWEWHDKRNEVRYQMNKEAGQNVDLKNALHTMRLLNMAEDIADGKGIIVRRAEAKDLIDIRKGKYSYDDILAEAKKKLDIIEKKFGESDLPDVPNSILIKNSLLTIRQLNHVGGAQSSDNYIRRYEI